MGSSWQERPESPDQFCYVAERLYQVRRRSAAQPSFGVVHPIVVLRYEAQGPSGVGSPHLDGDALVQSALYDMTGPARHEVLFIEERYHPIGRFHEFPVPMEVGWKGMVREWMDLPCHLHPQHALPQQGHEGLRRAGLSAPDADLRTRGQEGDGADDGAGDVRRYGERPRGCDDDRRGQERIHC